MPSVSPDLFDPDQDPRVFAARRHWERCHALYLDASRGQKYKRLARLQLAAEALLRAEQATETLRTEELPMPERTPKAILEDIAKRRRESHSLAEEAGKLSGSRAAKIMRVAREKEESIDPLITELEEAYAREAAA